MDVKSAATLDPVFTVYEPLTFSKESFSFNFNYTLIGLPAKKLQRKNGLKFPDGATTIGITTFSATTLYIMTFSLKTLRA